MSESVNRIMAEKDLRSMTIASSAQDGERMAAVQSNLNLELGEVYVGNPMAAERDEDAGLVLRTLSMTA